MIKGTITSINISKEKGVIKTPVDSAVCKCDHGIVGDAHAGNWHRQISLLAQESIDIMTEMGIDDLTPGQFAENLTTEGICLYELPVAHAFRLGKPFRKSPRLARNVTKAVPFSRKSANALCLPRVSSPKLSKREPFMWVTLLPFLNN